jgi:uncharacterized protein (TIGR04255 family)
VKEELMEPRKYTRDFLKNVIVRADFAAPVITVNDVWPSAVIKAVLKRFPIEEEHRTMQFSQVPDAAAVLAQPQITNETEKHYYSLDRNKHLGLGRAFLFIEMSKYEGFDGLLQLFEPVVRELFSASPDLAIKRLGLRYINIVAPGGRNPLQWSGLINSKLSSMLGFAGGTSNISRAMGNMEFNFEGIGLKIQYGVFNPDYPAVVKRKEFVLDIDAFSPGLASYGQFMEQLTTLHGHVENVFELAIGERLRKAMMAP